jgi:hypothetical protein
LKIIYGVAVPVSIPVGEIVAVALGSIVPLTPTVEVITVRRLLRQGRYVLRANRKRLNKKHDPDRDRQMHLAVTLHIAHLPTSASKWNPIGHKLFGSCLEIVQTGGDLMDVILHEKVHHF